MVINAMRDLRHDSADVDFGMDCAFAEFKGRFPAFEASLHPSSFGIAAAHTSGGRYELHLLPCIRVAMQGTRLVAIVCFDAVTQHLCQTESLSSLPTIAQVQTWVLQASKTDLQALNSACPGAVATGTIGPNDALYAPAGSIVFHRAMHGLDVLGVRIGLVGASLALSLGEVDRAMDGMPSSANQALKEAAVMASELLQRQIAAKRAGEGTAGEMAARDAGDGGPTPPPVMARSHGSCGGRGGGQEKLKVEAAKVDSIGDGDARETLTSGDGDE